MKIVITGGAGFVGSNLAIQLKQKYPSYIITSVDNLKRRGSEYNIPRLLDNQIEFIHADIRNKEDIQNLPTFEILIDASAEPSVLAGIHSPVEQVINNNLMGTVNCLELAKKNNASFVFISTNRVYPIKLLEEIKCAEKETRFVLSDKQVVEGVSKLGVSENFPLSGYRSFYGTTKLASEFLIEEYNALFGLKTVINRCGVIAGPWQMGKVDQGFLALWVAKHYWKQKLSYIGFGGEGKQVRDVLHIDDLVNLIDLQIHNIEGWNNQIFNVGGGINNSTSLLELTDLCSQVVGNNIEIIKIPETRPADIKIYITDNSKVSEMTNWNPIKTINDVVSDTFNWIHQHENLLKTILK